MEDDLVLIGKDSKRLQETISELRKTSKKVGLSMNPTKTRIRSPDDTPTYIGNNEVQRVEEYVNLGHQIGLVKETQQAEINGSIRMSWTAVSK